MNSLTRLHTGERKEQRKKTRSGKCVFANRGRHTCAPLHHYLTSPTRLQELPHRLSNNWSRRQVSLKYLVTKGAVENIVGGENGRVDGERGKRQTHEMREGRNAQLAG